MKILRHLQPGWSEEWRDPTIVVVPCGTAVQVGLSDEPSRDVLEALCLARAEDPYSSDGITRVIRLHAAGAGLQAEAGRRVNNAVMLYCRAEKLRSGETLFCWLFLHALLPGDAVYWLVSYGNAVNADLMFAERDQADRACAMIRHAGGGSSDVHEHWTEVPTDADLAEIESL